MTAPRTLAARLPCGASVDDLLAQVTEGDRGRTAHQRRCPHCTAALAEYRRLWAPVDELAREAVHPPDGVMQQVLRRIYAASDHSRYGVIPTPRGATRIAEQIVAVTARLSAEQIPGVRAALSHSADPDPGAGVQAGLVGGSTALRITVAASYGEDLHALADRVRAAVADAVRSLTGLDPVEISVLVDDVLERF